MADPTIAERAIDDVILTLRMNDIGASGDPGSLSFISPIEGWVKQIFISAEDDCTAVITVSPSGNDLEDITATHSALSSFAHTFSRQDPDNHVIAGGFIKIQSDGTGAGSNRATVTIVLGRLGALVNDFDQRRSIFVCSEIEADNTTGGVLNYAFPYPVKLKRAWTYTSATIPGTNPTVTVLQGATSILSELVADGTDNVVDESAGIIVADAVVDSGLAILTNISGPATATTERCGFMVEWEVLQ